MSYYGRPNPAVLENMGKPWMKEEIDQLLSEIKDGKSHKQIAIIHKRTIGSILSILKRVAANLHLINKMEIQQCIEITGLEKADVLDAIDKREYNERKKKRAAEIKAQVKAQGISVSTRVLDPVTELRKDMNELKKDVKEILRLMNALYEFEASQS
jgi:hypothetical protein